MRERKRERERKRKRKKEKEKEKEKKEKKEKKENKEQKEKKKKKKKKKRRTRRQKQVSFHNRTHRTFLLTVCVETPDSDLIPGRATKVKLVNTSENLTTSLPGPLVELSN